MRQGRHGSGGCTLVHHRKPQRRDDRPAGPWRRTRRAAAEALLEVAQRPGSGAWGWRGDHCGACRVVQERVGHHVVAVVPQMLQAYAPRPSGKVRRSRRRCDGYHLSSEKPYTACWIGRRARHQPNTTFAPHRPRASRPEDCGFSLDRAPRPLPDRAGRSATPDRRARYRSCSAHGPRPERTEGWAPKIARG